MQNYRMFTVKYVPATNTRGSRVKITDCRFNKSVTVPFNSRFNHASDIGENFLREKGIKIVGGAEGLNFESVFFTADFDIQIK